MKNAIKNILSSLIKFIACNLLGFIPGFVLAFLAYAFIRYNPTADKIELFNLLIYSAMVIGFAIAFYYVYFIRNRQYKQLYLDESYKGNSIKTIMGMHVKKFTKYELLTVFVISVLLSFVPSVILGKCGVSFLFASSGFFVDVIGGTLIGKDTFAVRLLGYALWDIYIAGCYFGCLRMVYWYWNKKRFKKPASKL